MYNKALDVESAQCLNNVLEEFTECKKEKAEESIKHRFKMKQARCSCKSGSMQAGKEPCFRSRRMQGGVIGSTECSELNSSQPPTLTDSRN